MSPSGETAIGALALNDPVNLGEVGWAPGDSKDRLFATIVNVNQVRSPWDLSFM